MRQTGPGLDFLSDEKRVCSFPFPIKRPLPTRHFPAMQGMYGQVTENGRGDLRLRLPGNGPQSGLEPTVGERAQDAGRMSN